jgi:hypothetical protein
MGNPETLVTLGTQDTGQRLEKTKGQIKNGQSTDTGQKLEKTQGQIKNGQSRDTGKIGYTGHRTEGRENPRANQEWEIKRHG